MRKVFLTGRPRCGKSTLLQKALHTFNYAVGGFAMQRLLDRGDTWAFRLLDLSHEPYITHLESNQKYDDIAIYRISAEKWAGNPEVFDGKGRKSLIKCLDSPRLVIMDELGIFEKDALDFQASVFAILDSSVPVLGVIKAKSNPFLDKVREHKSVEILNFADGIEPDFETVIRGLVP